MTNNFEQFVEFGQILDRPLRAYLVEYLQSLIVPDALRRNGHLRHFPPQFAYLKDALDKIFANETLLNTCRQNPTLAEEIVRDTLRWMRKAYEKNTADNPHQDERKELERWQGKPTFLWVRSWYHLTNYLRERYAQDEIDTRFYEQKFDYLTAGIDAQALERKEKEYAAELAQLDIVIEDLLQRWESLLIAKSLQWELENIDRQRAEFCELLYAKVEEFVRLLKIITPFQAEIGRFWDMSKGLWQEAGFDILQRYAELLAREESIQALADMLGRMREAEIETEEEIFRTVITQKMWVNDTNLRSEIGGVYQSNHLSQVLPSEISLLSYPETESVFLQRFADAQLLSLQYQGRRLVQSDKVNYFTQQREKRKEKGPFILCIDTSGSMEGLPEQIAKVLAFAIIKMAAQEQRKAFLINFSIGIQTINLLDLANSLDEVVKFLLMSFHGGTDLTPAMVAAVNMLQTNDYREADVLVVSDFVMFEIRPEIVQKIRQEQHKGTRFHSLVISEMPNPEIVHRFDHNWLYNPQSRSVIRQLSQDLESLRTY